MASTSSGNNLPSQLLVRVHERCPSRYIGAILGSPQQSRGASDEMSASHTLWHSCGESHSRGADSSTRLRSVSVSKHLLSVILLVGGGTSWADKYIPC